jgi:glycosyltransferase involved in cell wall biosynthesis
MPRIAMVVPCFNEERRLDVETFRAFTLSGHELHFLFVNDGSRDGTLHVLQTLRDSNPSKFDVLDLAQNSGKAEAVRRGILKAAESKPDFIGFWDADLATPLTELPAFVNIFTRPNIDIVFGARVRLLGREISRRPDRHYLGRVGATLISQTLGLAVYDTQCGAKVFRMNDALPQVFGKPFLSRWIFDVEIIARYLKLWGRDRVAASMYELPVTVWHDVKGSKVRSTDFLRALRDLWKIRRAYRLRN